MGATLLLGQLLPIDPQVAIDATKAAYDGFQKNFVVATVVSLVVSHAVWIVAYGRLLRKFTDVFTSVQEARVQDQKEANKRMSVHMDRAAEGLQMLALIEARKLEDKK